MDEFGSQHIVVTRPLKILTRCAMKHFIEICGGADITFLLQIADALVLFGVIAANVGGRVGRCIIRDNQLEIAIGLPEYRFDRLRYESFTIPDGHADRNFMHNTASTSEHGYPHDLTCLSSRIQYLRFRLWKKGRLYSHSLHQSLR